MFHVPAHRSTTAAQVAITGPRPVTAQPDPFSRSAVLRNACLAYAATTLGRERSIANDLAATAEDLTGDDILAALEDQPTLSANAERRMGC